MIRIVIADDTPEFLQFLVALLEGEFDVRATAADGNSALEAVRTFNPDVAVLDLEMPGLNGIEVTQELIKGTRYPAIVICSVHRDQEFVETAMSSGAHGYVSKTDCARDLPLAIRAAARGQQFRSPAA